MNQAYVDDLPPLQRSVMEALWAAGHGTVHEILARISPDKSIAYTSVLTAFQMLEKNGWVTHTTEGRQYVYWPARTQEEAGTGAVRRLINGVFGGDPFRLFRHFIEEESLTPEQLAELQKLIEEKRRSEDAEGAEEEGGHAGV